MMLSVIGLPVGGATATATAAQLLARCAAAAVAATLAIASGRNMYQTWSVCTSAVTPAPPSSHRNPDRQSALRLVDEEEELSRMEKGELSATITATRSEQIVQKLQKMNRQQLLQLYLDPTTCSAPSISTSSELVDLEGEWEGVLLENHGRIMTWVANLLTHRFFAAASRRRGRLALLAPSPPSWWRGKSFSHASGSSGELIGGANRIAGVSTPARQRDRGQLLSGPVEHQHRFDVAIGTTRFPSARGRRRRQYRDADLKESEKSGSKGDLALILTYNRHQPWYSPWKTMADELRVVRASSSESDPPAVLLGWGCMAWSGGILNASPFCLYRKDASSSSAARPIYRIPFGRLGRIERGEADSF